MSDKDKNQVKTQQEQDSGLPIKSIKVRNYDIINNKQTKEQEEKLENILKEYDAIKPKREDFQDPDRDIEQARKYGALAGAVANSLFGLVSSLTRSHAKTPSLTPAVEKYLATKRENDLMKMKNETLYRNMLKEHEKGKLQLKLKNILTSSQSKPVLSSIVEYGQDDDGGKGKGKDKLYRGNFYSLNIGNKKYHIESDYVGSFINWYLDRFKPKYVKEQILSTIAGSNAKSYDYNNILSSFQAEINNDAILRKEVEDYIVKIIHPKQQINYQNYPGIYEQNPKVYK